MVPDTIYLSTGGYSQGAIFAICSLPCAKTIAHRNSRRDLPYYQPGKSPFYYFCKIPRLQRVRRHNFWRIKKIQRANLRLRHHAQSLASCSLAQKGGWARAIFALDYHHTRSSLERGQKTNRQRPLISGALPIISSWERWIFFNPLSLCRRESGARFTCGKRGKVALVKFLAQAKPE